MSYFIYPGKLHINTHAVLEKEEAAHLLLSRRIKIGERVEIQDAAHNRFRCTIVKLGRREITFVPESKLELPAHPPRIVDVYQAYIAEQALHTVIQKLTELGVRTLTVFQSKHSPGKLSQHKLPRWQRISLEAAKQSGRPLPLDIHLSTSQQPPSITTTGLHLFLSQDATSTLSEHLLKAKPSAPVTLWIGPEGGWSTDEAQLFIHQNILPSKLGPYTLRAETATIAAASIALNLK